MTDVLSPKHVASTLTELWSPRVIAEVDDAYIKVAKVHGSLTWHSHENEDELFLVLKGRLRIEMESAVVELGEGEMFVVPRRASQSSSGRGVSPDAHRAQIHQAHR